jgi:hypothetical protein
MKGKLSQSSFIAALLVTGALALASCTDTANVTSGPSATFGPGGGSAIPPGQGTTGATGTRVQLLVSNPQIPSSGATTVDLTAVVLDVNGQAVVGTLVTFSTGTDPSAFVNQVSNGNLTDANGIVTAKLNLGANKSNRTITITASTPDGATISNTVAVTGTAITVSGNSSLALGANTTLTFALKDSAGTPIPNMTMTITSQTGNAIAPASALTDASGQVIATVTATVPLNDVLTASAAGATKTQNLTINSASFVFTTPAPSVDIPLNTPTVVSVHWTSGGAPVSGQAVTFSTSRGAITSSSTTNGTGDTPGVSIVSNTSAGPAIITAQGPGGTPAATLNVNFVATSATSVSVQAIPSIVQFTTNSPTQTNNISTITVTVRDANNNLVKNASITFTLTDITNGFLAAGSAITDLSGTASVNYTAGQISSAQNGVVIAARVDKVNGVAIPPITGSTTLTVAGQALFVRLGTDNHVVTLPSPDPDLQKKWSAIVTDAAGNAVAGAQVRFSLIPTRYSKGVYVFVSPRWVQTGTPPTITPPIVCPSEDDGAGTPANANNGILDPGEDTNGNFRLDPGNVASVNATATTDASGTAIATLTYPKSYATWTEVQLQASAGVVGNDPPTTATFFLEGLADDYTNQNVPPPGYVSPFGVVQDCTNPN